MCLLLNFRLFTVIDLSPGVLSAQQMTCLRRVIQAVIAAMTTRISSTCHLETAEPDFAVAKIERCQVVPDANTTLDSDNLILNERESDVKVN